MTKFRLAIAILLTTIILPFGASLVRAAVSLEDFDGSWTGSTVVLEFSTGSEQEHAGFYVWRSTSDIAPNSVSQSNSTRISPFIIGENACNAGGGGADYDYSDTTVSQTAPTYYYFLESVACSGGGSEIYGSTEDPDSGLRLNNPNVQSTPTNTPPANSTATNTPPANSTSTNTPTREATTAPGQPTNTPGPTGTLIPIASEVPATATPRPTNTAGPTSTTAPAVPTQANQTNPPTQAPVPTQPPPPTTAPVQPTQPSTSTEPTTVVNEVNPAPTETPAVIAAAVSPVVTELVPGGAMSSTDPAPTPTLAGGIAAAQGTGINSVPEDPDLVASSSDGDGVDGLIQGLIGVILVGVVGLVGFIGWNYMRNRQ